MYFQEYFKALRVGFGLVFRHKMISNVLITFLFLNIATASLEMLITIWAHDVLQIGSAGYGILLTSILLGSLVGSLAANFPILNKTASHVLISITILCSGLTLGLFSLFDIFYVSLITLFLTGGLFSILAGASGGKDVSPLRPDLEASEGSIRWRRFYI